MLAVGLGVGALSLVYFRRFAMQCRPDDQSESDPRKLALAIATGIGLHNFSEGLAIGQASSSGALSLAMVLVIGFGLHNMTEGFAIAAPLIGRHLPSWRFLTLAGLIAGGPTFLGTVLGMAFVSTAVFVLFLSLAGGAILYVVGELLHVDRMLRAPVAGMYGLLVGFLAGYGSDLIVTWSGA